MYVNREGLADLKKLIESLNTKTLEFKAVSEVVGRIPVFQDGDWSWLEIRTCSHEGFNCGGKPCRCGCQKEFEQIEDKYRAAEGFEYRTDRD